MSSLAVPSLAVPGAVPRGSRTRRSSSVPAPRLATDKRGATVGVMHACGHDIHMTNLIGASRLLSDNRERWSGTLVCIAQPAEELGAGAQAMLADN